MKFKLDENLGTRGANVLRSHGYDVATVAEQDMTSASDHDLITACAVEDRCLVTLDLDFSNILAFNPKQYCGIAVLRLPADPSRKNLDDAIEVLAAALATREIHGQLWVVQGRRIRQYESETED